VTFGLAPHRSALACLALALLAVCGCDLSVRPVPTVPKPPEKAEAWTAERITKDPEGYIQWADGQLAEQKAARTKRLSELETQLGEVARKREEFLKNVGEARNLHGRLEKGYQKAEEEDRWPTKVSGQDFDRRSLKAAIERTKQYVDERQPLEAAYESANRRLTAAREGLQKEIEDLGRLRERLSLDLERVRLNKGIEELNQLRQTESEIAAYAKVLREDTTTEDVLQALGNSGTPPPMTMDALMKQEPPAP
jgi:chromosome segregation ATPase